MRHSQRESFATFRAGFAVGIILGTHIMAFVLMMAALAQRDGAVLLFMALALFCFWVGRVTR